MWIVDTRQVSVVVSRAEDATHPYTAELMLSMTAAVIEDGRDPVDPVAVDIRALQGGMEPAWRIVTLAGGHHPGSADQGDACPSPEADAGHPHRRVDVEIIPCVDQREYERAQLGHSWLQK